MQSNRTSSKAAIGLAVFALLASLLASTPVSAQGSIYSTTATLGDGVDGLAVDRSTTIEAQVWAIESVGDLMLVGGAFTDVRDRSTYAVIPRPYLAAFDPTTGEYVPWFRTQPDGPVYDILDLGNNRAVLLGEFHSVNGVPGTDGVAVINVTTGLVDTSVSVALSPADSVVRAGALHNGDLYFTGSFTSVSAGGVNAGAQGVARLNLGTGVVDSGFTPSLQGGGGWGIGLASNGRVFVGGRFETVNNTPGTETLAALNPNGSLVSGWNHGFPHRICNQVVFTTCGAVTGLAVTNNRVFVAGAKHFWSALATSDGEILADNQISNDGQSVDVVDGMVVVGCHCSTGTGDDNFEGIEDRYIRVIDPVTLNEIESPTINSEGGPGGWAASSAPDGCLWAGGNFSSTVVGSQVPAWNLLRFCPNGGAGSNPQLTLPISGDGQAPATPQAPTISSQKASSVFLSWPTAGDNSGQVSYNVYRNGVLVGLTPSTNFADRILDSNQIYYWQISATDMAGNISALSPRSTPVEIGPRYNVAENGTATQSNDAAATTTAIKAIDGNTDGNLANGSVSRTGTVAGLNRPWWNLDLGSEIDVDYIQVFPRTDGANGYLETNTRLRIFYDTSEISGDNLGEVSAQGHKLWIGSTAPAAPVIERADIGNSVRYLQIFNSRNRVAMAEVRVFTSDPLPTPAQPTADTQDPSSNTWKQVVNRGANSVLAWGGDSDNVSVAYYEIYKNNQYLATSTDRWVSVGAAGQTASAFQIVSYDAAGNNSGVPALAEDITACSFVRNGTTVEVSWNMASNPSRFVVRRNVNGGTFFWRGSPSAAERTFTDSDRAGNLEYSVTSINGNIASEPFACAEDVVADPVPTELESTFADKSRIVLHWNGNTAVEIERDGIIIGTDSDTWFTDAPLAEGTDYTYRIRYVGSATWTDAIIASTTGIGGGDPKPAPATCTSTAAGNAVTVDWAPVAASEIIVERSVNDGTWWWRGKVAAAPEQFIDSNRAGTLSYRVKARYANGDSEYTTCSP